MPTEFYVCSDLHLREDNPVCRTDDIVAAIERKLTFLNETVGYNPVLCGGDVFDHWKSSPALISLALRFLPANFIVVPGQHDMPYHAVTKLEDSALWSLAVAQRITPLTGGAKATVGDSYHVVRGYAYGEDPVDEPSILLWHYGTWHLKVPYPGCPQSSAMALLQRFPKTPMIITGDTHGTFVVEHEGRYLINPGAMLRTAADEIDRRPCFYRVVMGKGVKVEPVYWPIEAVVKRDHIDTVEQRDQRLESFVSRMSEDMEVELNFAVNVAQYMEKNGVTGDTKQLVLQALETK